MKRAPLRDFLVGVLVLCGLGAIAYLSFNVGGLSFRSNGGLSLFAEFDEIGGLKPRAPVVIAGVKVGQVNSIVLDTNFRARVRLDVKSDMQLPTDTSAAIMTSGLLGDQYVSLQVGGEDRILKDGDTIMITESALSIERLIGKFIYSSDKKNGSGSSDEK